MNIFCSTTSSSLHLFLLPQLTLYGTIYCIDHMLSTNTFHPLQGSHSTPVTGTFFIIISTVLQYHVSEYYLLPLAPLVAQNRNCTVVQLTTHLRSSHVRRGSFCATVRWVEHTCTTPKSYATVPVAVEPAVWQANY